MSTIKSSDEHLTLNADGSSKDIKFQANGVEKASISSAGAFTSTTIDATKLTGNLPAISGAALTGVGVAGITSSADATAITIDSSENVGIGVVPETWDANYDALQIGGNGSLAATPSQAAGGKTLLGQNMYVDSSYKYISTDEASLLYQQNGAFIFRVAASGSADSAISWTNAMTIDNSGYLTIPNQPSCSVSRSSGQGSGSIEWNYVNYNTGNHFSTTTTRFTAPVAGKYLVNLFGMSNSSNTTMDIEVRINGNGNNILVPYENANGATLHQVSGSNIFSLSANDYLTVHVNTGSWYGGTAGRHNGFSVHLLA